MPTPTPPNMISGTGYPTGTVAPKAAAMDQSIYASGTATVSTVM